MAYSVSGTVTISGEPATNGEEVEIWAINGVDGELVAVATISGGTGAFSADVPDNTRDYRAVYDDGTVRGISALGTPTGTGAVAPTFQAAGTAVAGASPDSVILSPSLHIANDILVILLGGCYGAGANYAAPAGWAEFPNSPQVDATAPLNARLQAFWKRCVSSAEGSATIADVGGDDAKIAQIITIRGCAPTGDPFDVTEGSAIGTASTAVSIPGDTTTGEQRLVLTVVSHAAIDSASGQASGWTNADLTGLAEITDVCTTTSIGYGFAAAAGVKAVAGAFGATTATLAASATQARLMIAFKP